MDINPQSVKPISDDQELAKVLAGVAQPIDEPLQFDTPPVLSPTVTPPPAPIAPVVSPLIDEPALPTEPASEPIVGYNPPAPSLDQMPSAPPADAPSSAAMSDLGDLNEIKQDALQDLRPLVGKLDIPADEKFDTYLLLIRSTDDKALVAPAYAAAQAITDEARKAQALLEIIKEIDYLSNPAK